MVLPVGGDHFADHGLSVSRKITGSSKAMGPRHASGADRQILDAASTQGVAVSARQLERWRQQKVIPRAASRALGQGLGSESSYDGDQVDYIIEFARRIGPKRRPAQVAVWLYLSGLDVPHPILRHALVNEVSAYKAYLLRKAGTNDEIDAVDSLTQLMTHRRNRDSTARRRGVRATYRTMKSEGTLQPVTDESWDVDPPTFRDFDERMMYSGIGILVAGEVPETTALFELATDQLPHINIDELPERPDDAFVSGLTTVLPEFNFNTMLEAANEATAISLEAARQILQTQPLLAAIFGLDTSRPPEPLEVCAPLLMLLLFRKVHSDIEGRRLAFDELDEVVFGHETAGQSHVS